MSSFKRYQAITVGRLVDVNKPLQKFLNMFILYILIQVVWYTDYSVAEK